MTLQTKHKIFLASIAYRAVRITRKLLGKENKGQFQRGSFNWALDLSEVVDFMIYLSGGFESYLSRFISQNVQPGHIVMDIGANIGAHTLTMGQAVGASGKAYAIEATAYAYQKLEKNISLNPSIKANITPIHCVLQGPVDAGHEAISSESIHSSWPFDSADERHPAHMGVLKSLGNARHATLDEIVKAEKLPQLNLVKIDVDGHEWDVLSGGEETLRTLKPIILMELAPDYNDVDHARSFQNIHRFLQNMGYVFYDFKGKRLPENCTELAQTIPQGASRNVVITPSESLSIKYL